MPWLDPGAWAKLISSVFWPGVVVAAVYFFRAQIAELVRRISKFGWGPGVIEFATMVGAVGREVGETGESGGR